MAASAAHVSFVHRVDIYLDISTVKIYLDYSFGVEIISNYQALIAALAAVAGNAEKRPGWPATLR